MIEANKFRYGGGLDEKQYYADLAEQMTRETPDGADNADMAILPRDLRAVIGYMDKQHFYATDDFLSAMRHVSFLGLTWIQLGGLHRFDMLDCLDAMAQDHTLLWVARGANGWLLTSDRTRALDWLHRTSGLSGRLALFTSAHLVARLYSSVDVGL